VAWRTGGFLMAVDGADVISNRHVQHVRSHPSRRGFYIAKGYELDDATGRLAVAPRFNRLCGSSNIICWASDELPQHLCEGSKRILFRC
jgi:hypothetical protein